MKRYLFTIIIVLLAFKSFGKPEDNFKQSRYFIGGYGSITGYWQDVFSDNDDKSSSSRFYISPTIGRFMIDNLSMSIRPYLSVISNRDSWYDSYSDDNVTYKTNSLGIGLNLGINYYLSPIGAFVPNFGLGFGFGSDHGLKGEEDGKSVDDESYSINWKISPDFEVLYFFNDNFAIYGKLDCSFSYYEPIDNSDGSSWDKPDNYKVIENIDLDTGFYIGFRYFIPNSKKLTI